MKTLKEEEELFLLRLLISLKEEGTYFKNLGLELQVRCLMLLDKVILSVDDDIKMDEWNRMPYPDPDPSLRIPEKSPLRVV